MVVTSSGDKVEPFEARYHCAVRQRQCQSGLELDHLARGQPFDVKIEMVTTRAAVKDASGASANRNVIIAVAAVYRVIACVGGKSVITRSAEQAVTP